MKCQDVIDSARAELNDPEEVRWNSDALLAYFNDALQALASVRPDTSTITETVELAAGTRQELPATGIRLIKIVRNMGANGATPGRPVAKGDLQTKDAIDPTWHTTTGTGTVYEYFYDPLVPREFYVDPGVGGTTTSVLMTYAVSPQAVTTPRATDLPVDAVYSPALREWMLYRAWGGDDEQSPNYVQARERLNTFFRLLGAKVQADVAAAPKTGA